jgi:hypothetical protein
MKFEETASSIILTKECETMATLKTEMDEAAYEQSKKTGSEPPLMDQLAFELKCYLLLLF